MATKISEIYESAITASSCREFMMSARILAWLSGLLTNGSDQSVFSFAIIALAQSIAAARERVFLAKAIRLPAERSLIVTAQAFEVQPDHTRVVEIGCEVLCGTGVASAHLGHDIPHFGRELIDLMQVPRRSGGVATAKRGSGTLTGNHKHQADERERTSPSVITQNTSP